MTAIQPRRLRKHPPRVLTEEESPYPQKIG